MKSKQTKQTTVWKCIDCGVKLQKFVKTGTNESKVTILPKDGTGANHEAQD
jgi:hypothetical protein